MAEGGDQTHANTNDRGHVLRWLGWIRSFAHSDSGISPLLVRSALTHSSRFVVRCSSHYRSQLDRARTEPSPLLHSPPHLHTLSEMSDIKSQGKKGKGKSNAAATASQAAATSAVDAPQPAAPAAPSADALMDLLSSKIDVLEGKDSTGIDESALTAAELTALQTKMSNLQASMDAEMAAGQTPQSQIAMLLDLYKSEVQSRMVYSRLLTDQKDKLVRSNKHKISLESLCKELQLRNKKLSDDLRHLSTEQVNAHTDMKVRFEVSGAHTDKLRQAELSSAARE